MRVRELSGLEDLGWIEIPPEIEKMFGDAAEETAVEQSGGLVDNPEANAYVNAIGKKIAALGERQTKDGFDFRFGVVGGQEPNAFALPNGAIYVTQGLLRLLRNDAQLANVLGHEVAHIEEKHSMEQIQVNAGSTLVLALINALIGGRIGQEEKDQMTNLTLELVQNGYSQYDENEADEVGQALSTRAGWDPMGMVDVMTIFETLEKDVDPGSIEAYKRSHPYAKDRHRKAYSRIKNNELPVTGGEVVGAETYAKFLSDILKVPAGEEKESPIKAATEFLPPSPELIAARKVALAQAKPKMDWQMILGIGLVGFGILAVILTKKK